MSSLWIVALVTAVLCTMVTETFGQGFGPWRDSCGERFQCGQSPAPHKPPVISGLVVGGNQAKRGDYPWQVALFQIAGGPRGTFCGGTYVNGKYGNIKVITAAHCVSDRDTKDYAVVFGVLDQSEIYVADIALRPDTVTIHRYYNPKDYNYDIAIIGFGSRTEAFLQGTNVSAACLPSKDITDNENVLVSGWGLTWEGGRPSNTLQYAWLHAMTKSTCDKTGYNKDLKSTMICAAADGKDSCQGDSGGPLVAYRGDKWELVGVVSWGEKCASPRFPGVYTNVRKLRSWIKSNL